LHPKRTILSGHILLSRCHPFVKEILQKQGRKLVGEFQISDEDQAAENKPSQNGKPEREESYFTHQPNPNWDGSPEERGYRESKREDEIFFNRGAYPGEGRETYREKAGGEHPLNEDNRDDPGSGGHPEQASE
jgi:hypothetical protein